MVDGTAPRPARVTAAGSILIVLGSLAGAIGLVLLVVAILYGETSAVPDWVELAPGDAGAIAGGLAALGGGALLFGLAQVATGLAAMTGGRPWAWPAAIGLGAVGALLATVGLLPRDGGVTTIFALVVGAYLFVALAVAVSGSWFRRD